MLLPKGAAEPGELVDVKITAADDYELSAELVKKPAKKS